MKATRASRTVCCATILAAVDRTPPKALPGLSTRRPVVKMRESESRPQLRTARSGRRSGSCDICCHEERQYQIAHGNDAIERSRSASLQRAPVSSACRV